MESEKQQTSEEVAPEFKQVVAASEEKIEYEEHSKEKELKN
jgi:hypothetical protein